MRAVYLNKNGGPESLVMGDIPKPVPNSGEVLVRVHATAVTPTELKWFPTFHLANGERRSFPIVLSHEFSGVVESMGADAGDFEVGEEVYGLNDWFTNGAQAEFCVVAGKALASKPKSLRHVEVATVPISLLTAWQGLIEKCKLEKNQRVLIHGGSGGVGNFAVQLARWRGADVTVTAAGGNAEFVRALGANKVLDYRKDCFEELVRDVDVVFDTVGGETLERSWKVLKPEGRIVTIVEPPKVVSDPRASDAFMLVRADGEQLAQLAKMIDAGELRVFVEATYPLEEAPEAYLRAGEGGKRGKIALSVVDDFPGNETDDDL